MVGNFTLDFVPPATENAHFVSVMQGKQILEIYYMA